MPIQEQDEKKMQKAVILKVYYAGIGFLEYEGWYLWSIRVSEMKNGETPNGFQAVGGCGKLRGSCGGAWCMIGHKEMEDVYSRLLRFV